MNQPQAQPQPGTPAVTSTSQPQPGISLTQPGGKTDADQDDKCVSESTNAKIGYYTAFSNLKKNPSSSAALNALNAAFQNMLRICKLPEQTLAEYAKGNFEKGLKTFLDFGGSLALNEQTLTDFMDEERVIRLIDPTYRPTKSLEQTLVDALVVPFFKAIETLEANPDVEQASKFANDAKKYYNSAKVTIPKVSEGLV